MPIFNILDHIDTPKLNISVKSVSAVAGHKLNTSTSALYNEVVGVCPKCQQPMTTSIIANGDTVFFCQKDRVVLPQPDS